MKMERVPTILFLITLATMSGAAQPTPAAEKPGQLLTPELEMAVFRHLNKEDRLLNRQAVWPRNTEELDGGDDVSGEWVLFTTMFMNATTGEGIMYVKLEQDGMLSPGSTGSSNTPLIHRRQSELFPTGR